MYDIPLDYGGLNVEGDVATKVMNSFFGHDFFIKLYLLGIMLSWQKKVLPQN